MLIDGIRVSAACSQIFLLTLLMFHWIFDFGTLWGLSSRVENFSMCRPCKAIFGVWGSAPHSTESQSLVLEQLRKNRAEGDWAIWQHVFGKCLIIASGERLSKRDCLHFNWHRPLLLWSKSESERERATKTDCRRAKQRSTEGKPRTNKGAEGDTEEISINRSHQCYFLSWSEEETFRCLIKIQDFTSQFFCKSASNHAANRTSADAAWSRSGYRFAPVCQKAFLACGCSLVWFRHYK